MNWFYATKDKTQAGPVDEATLESLLQSRTITPETLIWKEGMDGWKSYSSVFGSAISTASVVPAGMMRCAECGQPFSPDQLISLGGRQICATCKPMAVQKVQEGVASFGPQETADQIWSRVQGRGFDFTIASNLSRTWKLVSGNFWPSLGVTLLGYIIMVAGNLLPFLNWVTICLVQPQIMAGMMWYFVKQFRGQEATVNDSFEGFRRGYGNQALYMLILMGIMVGVMIVLGIVMAVLIPVIAALTKADRSSALPGIIMVIVFVPIVIATWYVVIRWFFTPLLILDKGLSAIDAMRLSWRVTGLRFWKIFGLFLVIGLLSLAGMLALCLGLLVVLPVAFASMALLYEDAFGEANSVAQV